MRKIYTFLAYLIMPLVLIRLCWKAYIRKQKVSRLKERFGYVDTRNQGGIWLHAVSVGETIAAVPLVKKLQAQYPELPIVITTMTVTGAERVAALFDDRILHCYVPYDLPAALHRFITRKKPKILIIMETEIWPNLLSVCQQRKVPILLANARLSAKSLRGYQKIGFWMRKLLPALNYIAAQTKDDAERFSALGASPQQLVITGSVKFDMTVPESARQQAQVFSERFGMRPVWIAASTHEAEEDIIVRSAHQVLQQLSDALLLWVPRHPERFSKVMSLAKKQGFTVGLRSSEEVIPPTTQIVIGDSMGELLAYYAASDVAFVGGSLVPTLGGHNLLEPAMLNLPVISGPHLFNFTEIFRLLQEADAMRIVHDAESLANSVITLLQDGALRARLGSRGLQVVQQNLGAVDKHMALIAALLNHQEEKQ